jgi:thiol-disulfide isomerase/thioredoxin
MDYAPRMLRAPLAGLLALAITSFSIASVSIMAGFSTTANAATKPTKTGKPPKAPEPVANAVKFSVAVPFPAPAIAPGLTWLNSEPLILASLKGKVVLINFWTFACINCQRTLPHVKDLYAKYHDKGFEIVGIHTPEFDYEKELDNIKKAVKEEGITWPVVQDNNFVTWKKYRNTYWPAFYYLDKSGNIRHFHAGEGKYANQDAVVAALLAE